MLKFLTLCLTLCTLTLSYGQIYLTENFNAGIPATWTITDGGGATGDSWASGLQGGANSLDGSNCAFVDSDAFGNGTLLLETMTSPAFDASAATNLYLDFDQYYNWIGADSAIVEVFDGTTWVAVLSQVADIGAYNNPDQQHINITAYKNANMQIRFRYNDNNDWAWYWLVDNVLVFNQSCANPTALDTANVSTTAADLVWVEPGTATEWLVEWGPSGFALGSGTSVIVNTTPTYSLTGLSAATGYSYYVYSICGPGDTSIVSGPFTFSTPFLSPAGVNCISGGSGFYIFSDDMETNTGWTGDIGTGAGQWDFPTAAPGGNSGNTGPSGPASGTTFAEFEASGSGTNIASMVTPMIDLSAAADQAELSFYMHAFGAEIGTLNVGIGSSPTGPFTTVFSWSGQFQTAATDPWEHIGVDISTYLGQAIYVEFSYGGTGVSFTADMAIDLVQVEACFSCLPVNSLNVTNLTPFAADLNFTDPFTTGNYLIEYGPSGFALGSGTTVSASASPYSLSGLTPETDYDFYVTSICGPGDTSAVTGPFSFTSGISCPQPTALTATSVTGSSADIGWTNGGTETEWNIEYGPAGFAPGSGTALLTTTNPTTLNGLMDNTSYDVYVYAVCGPNDSSSTGPVLNFLTPCLAFVAPWSDDLESHTPTTATGWVSQCWTETSTTTFAWDIDGAGGTTSSNTGPNAAYNGTNFFFTEASSGATGAEATIESPVIDITQLSSPYLSFYYHMYGATINRMYIDIYDGATWILEVDSIVGQQQTANADPWTNHLTDLNAFGGTPNLKIRFRVIRGTSFTGDVSIDQIDVLNISCFPVSMLDTANLSETSVDLSWMDNNGASEWLIEYGPAGFTQGTGMTVVAGTNPYTLTGLVPQNSYQYYVSAICSPGDTSLPAGPSDPFTMPVAANDAAMVSFVSPTGPCGSDSLDILVAVANNGSNPLAAGSFSVDVTVSGDVTASFNSNYAGDTIYFNGSDTMNIGQIDVYSGGIITMTAIITYPGDVAASNDTISTTLELWPVEPLGYDATVCDADTAWLTAYAGPAYNWYDSISGGSVVGVGDSFLVPSISTQDAYYLEYNDINGTVNSTYAGGNSCGGGVMFDVTTTSNSDITGFNVSSTVAAGSPETVNVYYITGGTYVGNETNAAAWTLEGTYNVTSAGTGNPTNVTLGSGIPLTPGQSVAIYLNYASSYTNGNGTNQFITDGTVSATLGVGLCGQFTSVNNPRIFNGDILYGSPACSAIRTPVRATAGMSPMIDLGPDTSYCAGSSAFLDGNTTGAVQYFWSNGDTTVTTNVSTPGTYVLAALDGVGCLGEDTVVVSEDPLAMAGFTLNSNGLDVTMSNSAMNADSVLYDMGDGNVTSDSIYTYASAGVYTVCQIAYNNCGTDTTCQSTTIVLSNNTINGADAFNIYPNPNNGKFVLEISSLQEQLVSLDILAVDGKKVYEKTYGKIQGQTTEQIDLSSMPSGIYLVKLMMGDEINTQKLIIRD